jgi:hypothetical protein
MPGGILVFCQADERAGGLVLPRLEVLAAVNEYATRAHCAHRMVPE